MGKRLTLEKIKERLRVINPNIKILSKEYINAHEPLTCECTMDYYNWQATWNDISQGKGCPVCAGRVLHDTNRLSLIRPDLIKYFVDKKDADNYTVSSGKKVQLKCPECGMLKSNSVFISNLSKSGFSCEYCSCKYMSLPERFGRNLFKEIGISFKSQHYFINKNRIKYDFYIPSLNIIIETHGEQHYKYTGRGRSLKEEQENDLYKYNLAIENGIKSENYIVIDCRKSEFNWLKENYIKQLENILDVTNVDWLKIWENCQSKTIVKVWDAWNNKKDDDTTKTIAIKFSLNRSTVIKYLKIGTEIGKCNYNASYETSKSNEKRATRSKKPTYQYTNDGYFLNKFESVANVETEFGFSNSRISECCNDICTKAYGFKWSYNPPINGMYTD